MPNNPFLVDTSAWILALRKDFLPEAKDRIAYLLNEDAIITSGMIKLELLGGTRAEKEFQRLKTRLDALEMVKTNNSLWEKAYDLAFRLRRKGITVPYTDILIAASAIVAAATVVHADSHFDLMGPHCGLKVESFVKATMFRKSHKKVKK
jgi:predicted nucleic acid-binding protein